MTRVRLGFKAFDLHELGWHFVARASGAYARRGLEVGLLDTTFVTDDALPADVCPVACGAALGAWLRGLPIRVLGVATDRPMFWLYGRAATLAALRGARISGYPTTAPPAHFLAAILRGAGLDPARDVTIAPARDDVARAGLLTCGEADAAVLSSAAPLAAVERAGFRRIAFFGDHLRMPSTGLAVPDALRSDRPEAVAALVAAFAESLARIHAGDAAVREALQAGLRVPADELDAAAALMGACFTADGRSPPDITSGAVAAMAGALGVTPPGPAGSFYDFSLLPG